MVVLYLFNNDNEMRIFAYNFCFKLIRSRMIFVLILSLYKSVQYNDLFKIHVDNT